jgi:cell division protein FtsQ
MARRRSSNRRRRRGRFGFLYKILSILAICAVIVVALTLFFKVDTIQITGGNRYSKQEIVNASGIKVGDNLFLLNKFDMAAKILKKLPYIENVRINRKLPDCMVIHVEECSTAFAVEKGDTAWLISPSGKIVDSRSLSDAKKVPVIDGCSLTAPSVGSAMDLSTRRKSQRTSLLALMKALESAGVTDQVNAIHLKSTSELTMDYAGRFAVKMPYNGNYTHLVKYLRAVIKQLESNETGTIDLMTDGEAHVLPNS